MMKEVKFYRCPICGNVVYLAQEKGGQLVCCGKPMELMNANESDGAIEKHVPVYEVKEDKLVVKIGEVLHPMTEEHYIGFVAIASDNGLDIVNLKPGDDPICEFPLVSKGTIYDYCNLHGLWKCEIK